MKYGGKIMGTIVLQTLVTIVCAVLASSGFWAWLQKKDDKKSLQSQMLLLLLVTFYSVKLLT